MIDIRRKSGTITVSGGSGDVDLVGVYIRTRFIGVQGPNATATFDVKVTDTDTGVVTDEFKARPQDNGNARSKSLGLPVFSVNISVSAASVDGTYTFLLMG